MRRGHGSEEKNREIAKGHLKCPLFGAYSNTTGRQKYSNGTAEKAQAIVFPLR